jgi:putative acetyltransferase
MFTVFVLPLLMKNTGIILRTASEFDIPAISALYSETVRNVNAADYSPEQIEVWSSSGNDSQRWKNSISEQYFVVAEIDGVTVGFCSITKEGYLDFMYVHKDYQRMGTAKALLDEIERKAMKQDNPQIYSHVSKTARRFFEKFGYIHKEDLIDVYKGVTFINALMVKDLT